MKTKNLVAILIFGLILVSCASVNQTVQVETAIFTSTPTHQITLTPIPTATSTVTQTPSPEPTAVGGSELKIAIDEQTELIVGRFISGNEILRIEKQSSTTTQKIQWSPNGKYVIFSEYIGKMSDEKTGYFILGQSEMLIKILNVNSRKVETVASYPGTVKSGGRITANDVLYYRWSPDSQSVFFYTFEQNQSAQKNNIFLVKIKDDMTFDVQGIKHEYDGWLSDGKHIFNDSEIYSIDTGEITKIKLYALKGWFSVSDKYRYGIYLDYPNIYLVPIPKDLSDISLWDVEALEKSKFLIATVSNDLLPRGKDSFYSLGRSIVNELADGKIFLSGRLETLNRFSRVVDLNHLPVTITSDDINDEIFLASSPDGTLFLTAYCVYFEFCVNFDANFFNPQTNTSERYSNYEFVIRDLEGNVFMKIGDPKQLVYPRFFWIELSFYGIKGVDFNWQP